MDNREKWLEIDSRELPAWFDEAKLGIFIHWGIYSVPSYAPRRENIKGSGMTYAEWYSFQVKQHFPPYYDFHKANFGNDTYEDFVSKWHAELFDADEWAKMFSYSGAKYIGVVSKHHDGFCLWDSTYSPNWNSVVLGPQKNLLKEILEACEKVGIRRGVYYSLLEWEHPLIKNENSTLDFSMYSEKKMIPELKELVEKFSPDYLFTDGEWSATAENFHSLDFLDWLIHRSTVKDSIIFNDRWGNDTRGVHGGYFTTEYGEVNSAAINEQNALRNLENRKWEECRSISHSFGFNRNENIEHYLSEKEMLYTFVDIVCKGGNLILNVAPCHDGTISPLIQERLWQLGNFMKVNGEAIYASKPIRNIKLPEFATATQKNDAIFVFLKKYSLEFDIEIDKKVSKIDLLGSKSSVEYIQNSRNVHIKLPYLTIDELPCREIYTLKIV